MNLNNSTGYSRTVMRTKLRFYYYHWVDTSAVGLLIPHSIFRPVVSAIFITEIYSSSII